MNSKEYMSKPYTKLIQYISDESGSYYFANVLELEGCISHGSTPEEAYKNLDEAMELWIEVALAEKKRIPEPLSNDGYSGKFVLRIPKSLHKKLAIEAKLEGLSLNQYVLYKLAQ